MKRFGFLLVALVIAAASCGGGDDAATTTASPDDAPAPSTEAPTTAPPAPPGGDVDQWCLTTADEVESAVELEPAFDPDALRNQINEVVDRMREAQASAPSEIADDVAVLVDAMSNLRDLFEEYDYDFMRIAQEAENDPRLTIFDSEEVNAASNRIVEFCGGTIGDPIGDGGGDDGGDATTTTFGDIVSSDELPDDFPAELVPPGADLVSVITAGPAVTAEFRADASSLDDVVAFYTAELGDPFLQEGTETLWTTFTEGTVTSVTVSTVDGDVAVFVTVASS